MAKATGRIKLNQNVLADMADAEDEVVSPAIGVFRGFGVDLEGEQAIEDTVEGVLKAEVEAEKVVKVEEPSVVDFGAPAFIANKHLVIQLRKNDPPTKRTCSICKRRVLLHKIGFGHAEICDDCK